MPYTLDQLEFVGIHLQVTIPPELLEKKRSAGGSKEPPKPETPKPDEAAQAKLIEKKKSLLEDLSKLTEPPFATGEALSGMKADREAATKALAAEIPTPEQLQLAEQAITAFGEKVGLEKTRVSEKRKSLQERLLQMTDPSFASGDALQGLATDRETATSALSGEYPTSEQFDSAEKAITAFGEKLELEKQRVREKRKSVQEQVLQLVDPPYAGTEALSGLKTERENATKALSGEYPTGEQFQTAEKAIVDFGQKVELEKRRVEEKRKALQEEAGKLTDPTYGSPEALLALKAEREKATNALTPELPTAEQIKTAEEAIAAFGQKLEEEKQRVIGKKATLLQQANGLTDPDYADAEGLKELKTQRDAAKNALADTLPTPAQFLAAEQAITAFGQKAEEAKQRAKQKGLDLKSELSGLTDPTGADVEEKKATNKARDAANNALLKEAPTPAEIKAAEKAIARLKELIKQSKKMGALATKNPTAAVEARKALKGFRDKMLDEEVTPEKINGAKQELAEAEQEYNTTLGQWQTLGQAPTGETPEQETTRLQRREEVANLWRAANTRKSNAVARKQALDDHEKAVLGDKLLTEATENGPLSGDSGQKFSDTTATKLVQAFTKDPRLADVAVKSAATAKYPDALADGLDNIIDKVADGFARSDRVGWVDKEHARNYGENLLKMGGNVSGYFARLPEYIASGQQFEASPIDESGATNFDNLAHKRSVSLAKNLIKPDGSIDLTSDGAKKAIGSMLFHPKAMLNQTPSMTSQVLKTVKFLEDPTTGPLASDLLKSTVKPTDPGAQKLIRKSLRKGDTEAVDDGETRVSVLAAMLKPMHQGEVGSCFSTAPARRLRETQPLEAMKAFSDIASKGTYKPKFGVEAPVVTNLPEDDDPIQRSWEFTLATSTARTGDSNEKTALVDNIGRGLDQFQPLVGGSAFDWQWAKAKLRREVKTGFTFVYDPMSKVTDSNDGSSTQGRYITKRVSNGNEIRNKEDFIKELTEMALKALGVTDVSSSKATEIKDLVKSDGFINAVCPGKYKPWELSSGGQTEAATKTLLGDTMRQQRLLEPSPQGVKPPEGERTTAVLKSFLNGLGSRTESMVTVRTVGRHGFNALPNHPSLAGLKGANPSETASKIQTNLLDKGAALKNTDLTAERAAWLFDQEMKKALDGETDPVLKAELEKGAKSKRPTGAVKPAQLTQAIKEASHEYHTLIAEKRTKEWKDKEILEGRTVDPLKETEKKTKMKSDFDTSVENGAKSLLIRDMGAPEFVIADTNWGGPKHMVSFVISPDPTTGDPVMWQKTEPPGSFYPAGREWVDDEWAHIS